MNEVKEEILARQEFDKKYNFASSTPMMQQYLNIKYEHQDCYVLFRMGDFYELFFSDAIKASAILGVTLAKRGKSEGEDIPMCGVPHHSLENYLHKLLETNAKVAISEQMESPEEAKKRGGYKAVVKRDVTRIITPGTVIEERILETNKPNYLAAIKLSEKNCSICYADITTGHISIFDSEIAYVTSDLARINPKEIIILDADYKNPYFRKAIIEYDKKLVFRTNQVFEISKAKNRVESYYKISSYLAIGQVSDSQISSIGALIEYLSLTHKANLPKLEYPFIENPKDYMRIDPATIKSLEIVESVNGKRQGSLLQAIDKTITNSASRMLYKWLLAPLTNIEQIRQRQKFVRFFLKERTLSAQIRKILKNLLDAERSCQRIAARKCTHIDLLVIKNLLSSAYVIKEILYTQFGFSDDVPELKEFQSGLTYDYAILDLISDSINDEPYITYSSGGYIKPEYHARLQELARLVKNSHELVEELKVQYQKISGVENIKIQQNNILGFFIEVSSRFADKFTNPIFIYKQSTSNTIRYFTEELKDLESKIVNANSNYAALEQQIFEEICSHIEEKIPEIKKVINIITKIDLFSSFAELATDNNYTQPEISDDTDFIIKSGRHPVVEEFLKKSHKNFIDNNLQQSESEKIILLTGPNMGGKSTYLRQCAIIGLIAQIGSFVPAEYCKIGVIDKIFSRVGSGDDLSGGKSTFMMEMIETSAILAQATDKSFIILDEVGRGTATYDGMAIAWAILEHIHNKLKTRCLFATHYHELTSLSTQMPMLKNYSVSVEEIDNQIFFSYKVRNIPADKSYGIHVAELAGIPASITQRANSILKKLEKQGAHLYNSASYSSTQKSLFEQEANEFREHYNNLASKIKEIDLDGISPRDAYDIICNLQNSLKAEAK